MERGVADNIINVPLRAARRRPGVPRRLGRDDHLPALDGFEPGLLIISAGFDAHIADPLAQLRLETVDYAWMTDQLVAVADGIAAGGCFGAGRGL